MNNSGNHGSLRFKVGDVVKIINDTSTDYFIGMTASILEVRGDSSLPYWLTFAHLSNREDLKRRDYISEKYTRGFYEEELTYCNEYIVAKLLAKIDESEGT